MVRNLERPRIGQALAFHRFLLRFALAGTSMFAWVFLFQYFYIVKGSLGFALAQVALLYALSSITASLVTPCAARLLRNGARRTIVYALVCIGGAFVLIGSAFEGLWGREYTGAAIALFALLFGIYRALYWIPYEIEAAAEGGVPRGSFTGEIFIAFATAGGGMFIAAAPMAPILLFFIGAGMIALSAFPLLWLHDVHEGFSWGYRQTFHELLSREHRMFVTDAILEGVSGAALLLFWPLAVFLLVGWSYPLLGIVLSFTFLVALFARMPVRALLRRAGFQDSRLLTTVLALTPWLFRLVIATPVGVVLVDSYFYTTTPRKLGVDPFAFEQTSDGGSFVDEYTALKEMALNVGRATVCFLGAGAALFSTVPVAFVAVFGAAAVASTALALRNP